MVDGSQGDFKLQQDRIAGALRVEGRIDKARSQGVVGSGDQDDPVLSFGVDDDRRVAGRKRFVGGDVYRVDSVLLELLDELLPPGVLSYASKQAGAGAKPGERHGLVGALAARYQAEVRADHCLSGRREFFSPQHDIHVDAADHEDPRLAVHSLLLRFVLFRQASRAGSLLQTQMV